MHSQVLTARAAPEGRNPLVRLHCVRAAVVLELAIALAARCQLQAPQRATPAVLEAWLSPAHSLWYGLNVPH